MYSNRGAKQKIESIRNELSKAHVAGVTRQDRLRNEVIRSNLKIKSDIVEKVELRRRSYFGHVARMNQYRFPYCHAWSREWMQKRKTN